ncbi:putative membrane protein [Natranaeroarchaeum sulfidigenes]|uniref:Putative membrane protein n=1 Tax=Natranaeroarchaeum sulfidigenes TaxID=2784880 RepID=A0A897N0W1_9EURY|nr:putative membrane protein [Natranaeroarchaeum sulfidigenes]
MDVLVELVAYLLLAVVITGLGLLAELQSLSYLLSGETMAALWLAGMGILFLYAGVYMLGYGKLMPAVRQL